MSATANTKHSPNGESKPFVENVELQSTSSLRKDVPGAVDSPTSDNRNNSNSNFSYVDRDKNGIAERSPPPAGS